MEEIEEKWNKMVKEVTEEEKYSEEEKKSEDESSAESKKAWEKVLHETVRESW